MNKKSGGILFFKTAKHDVIPAGSSHGVSSELSRSYSQLSEVHVSVWPIATAVHHPHGHWCPCGYPHRGNHNNPVAKSDTINYSCIQMPFQFPKANKGKI